MNLGYACINMTLGSQKPKVTTNRSMIKKTFLEKGIPYASELGIQNARDLVEIIKWNHQNGINFFRLSSEIFPWASEYDFKDMPHYNRISPFEFKRACPGFFGNYLLTSGIATETNCIIKIQYLILKH